MNGLIVKAMATKREVNEVLTTLYNFGAFVLKLCSHYLQYNAPFKTFIQSKLIALHFIFKTLSRTKFLKGIC